MHFSRICSQKTYHPLFPEAWLFCTEISFSLPQCLLEITVLTLKLSLITVWLDQCLTSEKSVRSYDYNNQVGC